MLTVREGKYYGTLYIHTHCMLTEKNMVAPTRLRTVEPYKKNMVALGRSPCQSTYGGTIYKNWPPCRIDLHEIDVM